MRRWDGGRDSWKIGKGNWDIARLPIQLAWESAALRRVVDRQLVTVLHGRLSHN